MAWLKRRDLPDIRRRIFYRTLIVRLNKNRGQGRVVMVISSLRGVFDRRLCRSDLDIVTDTEEQVYEGWFFLVRELQEAGFTT